MESEKMNIATDQSTPKTRKSIVLLILLLVSCVTLAYTTAYYKEQSENRTANIAVSFTGANDTGAEKVCFADLNGNPICGYPPASIGCVVR